jgi:hypothetical protein
MTRPTSSVYVREFNPHSRTLIFSDGEVVCLIYHRPSEGDSWSFVLQTVGGGSRQSVKLTSEKLRAAFSVPDGELITIPPPDGRTKELSIALCDEVRERVSEMLSSIAS